MKKFFGGVTPVEYREWTFLSLQQRRTRVAVNGLGVLDAELAAFSEWYRQRYPGRIPISRVWLISKNT